MARVSAGIPLQIVLVICLSVVEFFFQGDGRDHFILEATDLIDLINHVFDNRFLCIVTIERCRAIRSAKVIPPKRAASKSRINTSPAFSAGRVSLLKPSYAFALE